MIWREIGSEYRHNPSGCIIAVWSGPEVGWLVGEAHQDEEGKWWWANESSGDYYAESLESRFGRGPEYFMPLPAPPKVVGRK